jgi:hypothetical protein
MNNNFLEFYLNEQVQISSTNFVTSIILAAILSLLIQLVYVKFSTSLSNKLEFSKNFVILGVATTLVITIVKSSLALSLGLVGALSIVRFRAAIKEPEELVYLFLIIATGLGCGSGQIQITLIGILMSTLIIISYSLLIKKKKLDDDNLINSTLVFNKRMSDKETEDVINDIKSYCSEMKFVSLSYTENETTINLDIKSTKFENLNKISQKIKKKYNKAKILFAKNNMLSL